MSQKFAIVFLPMATQNLSQIKVFDRRRVVESVERRLTVDPAVETRDKKCLRNETAPFEYSPPLWGLRVGEFRVFYTINMGSFKVDVHKIGLKPPNKTTAEVLNEADSD